jgi:hypothetical protein
MLTGVFPFLRSTPSSVLPTYFPKPVAEESANGDATSVDRSVGESRRLTLAVLGACKPHKGAAVIAGVLPKLVATGIHVVFLGSDRSEWPIDEYTAQGCSFLGHYAPFEAVAMLRRCDATAVLLPSVWPETFMRRQAFLRSSLTTARKRSGSASTVEASSCPWTTTRCSPSG